MSEFISGKENYQKGKKTVNGRNFQIEFWEDSYGLRWVKVSELIVKPVKVRWYSKKTEMREVEHYIDDGWTSDNRIDVAERMIHKYIENEQLYATEKAQIDMFCSDEMTKER